MRLKMLVSCLKKLHYIHKILQQLFRFFLPLIFFFSLCFASVFFFSLCFASVFFFLLHLVFAFSFASFFASVFFFSLRFASMVFFLLCFASVFFFSLCFASVFFVSLQGQEKKEAVFPSFCFKIFFCAYFCFVSFALLLSFRFVLLFSLRFAPFPFRFICKIYCFASKQNKETNPSVSLWSEKNLASVSLSFALNRKRTAHPIHHRWKPWKPFLLLPQCTSTHTPSKFSPRYFLPRSLPYLDVDVVAYYIFKLSS